MGRAPCVEPAGIKFAAHQRAGRLQLAQPRKAPAGLLPEVDHIEQVFAITSSQIAGRIAGKQRDVEAAVDQRLPQFAHVLGIVAV